MRPSTTLQTIAVTAACLAVACSDQNEPSVPTDQPDPLSQSVQQEPADNPNALGRAVRGFGGFFLDTQGTPTVYLKNASERGNVERALAPLLPRAGPQRDGDSGAPRRLRLDPARALVRAGLGGGARPVRRGLRGRAAVGQTVNKVGRTTGWTQGLVTNTCVNTGVSGSNIVQLCQTFVSAGVGGGDSGSPVFRGTSSVTLVGILWGGNSSGTQFVYSPIANIEQELGALTTQ
jgi:hypothetical protein